MRSTITSVVLFFLLVASSFAANELLGLVNKTTGRGVPDARSLFVASTNGVVTNLTVTGTLTLNGLSISAIMNAYENLDSTYVNENQANSISYGMMMPYSIGYGMMRTNSIDSFMIVDNSVSNQDLSLSSVAWYNMMTNSIRWLNFDANRSGLNSTVEYFLTATNGILKWTARTNALDFSVWAGDGLINHGTDNHVILDVDSSWVRQIASEYMLEIPTIIYVSEDGFDNLEGYSPTRAKRNISAAVDACDTGWTILVADGTYAITNTVYVNRNITIKSINGPDNCIIDGITSNRCFQLSSATLDGLTITRGYHYATGIQEGGGAVQLSNATIKNCIFHNNNSQGDGYYGNGGAIEVEVNAGIIQNCIFYDNIAENNGGAISFVTGSSLQKVENCLFYGNSADWGGAIYATWWGAAANSVTIEGSTITDNTATGTEGGGIMFYQNNAYQVDMAIHMKNTICYGNNAAIGANYHYRESPGNGVFTQDITYTCNDPLLPGTGNTSSDPLFTSSTDFHLTDSSPALNTGRIISIAPGQLDIDGNPRITGGKPDMGCYESLSY